MRVVQEVRSEQSERGSAELFWCKIFQTRHDFVVAVCDEDLLDAELKMKTGRHKVKVSKQFYGGKKISAGVALRILEKATNANLMGRNIVALAEENGFITSENIITIDGTPHAQFVKIIQT